MVSTPTDHCSVHTNKIASGYPAAGAEGYPSSAVAFVNISTVVLEGSQETTARGGERVTPTSTTPGTAASAFFTAATQWPHVIPVIASATWSFSIACHPRRFAGDVLEKEHYIVDGSG
jgi:hypothetical protein